MVAKALRSAAEPIQTLQRTLDVQTRRTAVSTVERLLATAAPIIVNLREHGFGEVRRSSAICALYAPVRRRV